MTYRQIIQDVARENHGIITTEQGRAAGVPSVEVRKIAARGYLRRIGHGAYRVMLVPDTPLTPYAAALAIAGSLSHLGPAATLAARGLIAVRKVIDVCVPRWPSRADVRGVRVTCRFRHHSELTRYEGLAVLTLVAALADHEPEFGEQRVGVVLDEARVTGRISEAEWHRVRELRHQRGRRDC